MEGSRFVTDLPATPSQITRRSTFPSGRRCGMFILSCNLIGLVRTRIAHAVPIVPLGCALFTWFYYHYTVCAKRAGWLPGAFIGRRIKTSDCAADYSAHSDVTDRSFQPPCARDVADTSVVCQHVCRRNVTLVFFSLIPAGIPLCSKVAYRCVGHSDYILCCWRRVSGEATSHAH